MPILWYLNTFTQFLQAKPFSYTNNDPDIKPEFGLSNEYQKENSEARSSDDGDEEEIFKFRPCSNKDQQEIPELGSPDYENHRDIPIHELAPKKKRTVYVWACCCCPTSGMKVSTVDCPGCGTPRCPYCRVEKKTIRG